MLRSPSEIMTEAEFNEELYKKHFRVTIFGSARIQKDDPIYKEVYELSKLIAGENIDLVTGGGPGLMHAANAGHMAGRKDDAVHSMGLNIKLPHEQDANRHLDIKHDFERFSARLDHFMMLSDVVLVAPGGVGTLLEFFYTWQLIQVKHICDIPIILLGDMWPELIKWVEENPLKNGLLNKEDLDSNFLVKDADEAFDIIKKFHDAFRKGKETTCVNYKIYKHKDLK